MKKCALWIVGKRKCKEREWLNQKCVREKVRLNSDDVIITADFSKFCIPIKSVCTWKFQVEMYKMHCKISLEIASKRCETQWEYGRGRAINSS